MRHHDVSRQAVEIRQTSPNRIAGDLRLRPFNRIGDRSVAQNAEIVSLIGVLPDVLRVNHKVLSESLLDRNVIFVPRARRQGVGDTRVALRYRLERIHHRIVATGARKNQVFIERRLQCTCIGSP